MVFIFVFFTTFFLHEVMHGFENFRQVRGLYYVTIDFRHLGMTCYGENDAFNDRLVSYAGGVYTGVICFVMVFVTVDPWRWSFLTMGWVQLLYGLYEGQSVGVRYRYVIYIGVITIMVIMRYIL